MPEIETVARAIALLFGLALGYAVARARPRRLPDLKANRQTPLSTLELPHLDPAAITQTLTPITIPVPREAHTGPLARLLVSSHRAPRSTR